MHCRFCRGQFLSPALNSPRRQPNRKEGTMTQYHHSRAVRNTVVLLIVTMGLLGLVPQVNAGFIPSSDSRDGATLAQDLEIISQALENKLVKQRLQDLGYSEQEIQDRLEQLSAEEVHQLALQIDSLTQGGILGFVIAVLVIVVLVLVILRLA
jgi:hypothetical protein